MNCYKPVRKKSAIANWLLDYAINAPKEAWIPYYNFEALPVPHQLLDKDPVIRSLGKKRSFHAGILRLPPNTCYNWHVDTDRHVSLNMLLYDDENSKCVFAPADHGIVMPIVELKYQPETYYVFNTKVMHTVLNFSTPRYIFSVEFLEKDRGLTFDELCNDIQGLNYVD